MNPLSHHLFTNDLLEMNAKLMMGGRKKELCES